MPGPHFRESDIEHQRALAAVDFQSTPRDPADLDIANGYGPVECRNDARALQAAYYAVINLIDDQVGRVLRALDDSAQRENTMIVFTSDHGEMLGDLGLIQKGCRFYEGLVRVPLIIAYPGQFQRDTVSTALVELTDLAPTILEVAGLRVPDEMQGRSLVPILRGDANADSHRAFVRCEYFDALEKPDATFATMYRDSRYKILVYDGHGLGELYDLESDPWEFEDLWDSPDHSRVKCELVQRSFDASNLASIDVGPRRIGPM